MIQCTGYFPAGSGHRNDHEYRDGPSLSVSTDLWIAAELRVTGNLKIQVWDYQNSVSILINPKYKHTSEWVNIHVHKQTCMFRM
jgi:hypothetical protein